MIVLLALIEFSGQSGLDLILIVIGIPLGSYVLLVECLATFFLLRGKELAFRLPLHKMSAFRLQQLRCQLLGYSY